MIRSKSKPVRVEEGLLLSLPCHRQASPSIFEPIRCLASPSLIHRRQVVFNMATLPSFPLCNSFRAHLGTQNPGGIPPISLGRPPLSILASGQTVRSFGSPKPWGVPTLSSLFPRGDRSGPPPRLSPSVPRDSRPTPLILSTRRRSASSILAAVDPPQATSAVVPDPRRPGTVLPSSPGKKTPSPPHLPASVQASSSSLRPGAAVLPLFRRRRPVSVQTLLHVSSPLLSYLGFRILLLI
jgi:hypothetical protein